VENILPLKEDGGFIWKCGCSCGAIHVL
jgi:hypothetical protein